MASFLPLPGIPPNFSVLAAMSAGLLPANIQVANEGVGPSQTLLSELSDGGATGNQFNAVANTSINGAGTGPNGSSVGVGGAVNMQASMPESGLVLASPPGYGGN